MKLSVVCGFAIFLMAGSANAQSNQNRLGTLDSMSNHLRVEIKPFSEQNVVGRHGRTDRVFRTNRPYNQARSYYLKAYRQSRTLPGGVTVAGYFVNETRGYATITLYQAGHKFLLNIHNDREGARFVLWGKRYLTHRATVEKYKKRKTQKRRYHRGHPPARVHRYRL